MGQRASSKYGSFENDIQLQLGPTVSYLMASPVIKVALERIKIIFYHEKQIQTEGNQKCCNLKSWLSSTFSVPKKFTTIQEFQGITWNHEQMSSPQKSHSE